MKVNKNTLEGKTAIGERDIFEPPESRKITDCKFYTWLLDNYDHSKARDHDWLLKWLDEEVGFDKKKHYINRGFLDALKGAFGLAVRDYLPHRNKHPWQELLKVVDRPADEKMVEPDTNLYPIRINVGGYPNVVPEVFFALTNKAKELFELTPGPWKLSPLTYVFDIDTDVNGAHLYWCTHTAGGKHMLASITNYDLMGEEVLRVILKFNFNYFKD